MRLIYICFLVLLPLAVSSQEETFYIQFDDQSVADAFAKIEDTYDVLFSYKDTDISNNSYPKKAVPTKIELYKQSQAQGENAMQRAKQ